MGTIITAIVICAAALIVGSLLLAAIATASRARFLQGWLARGQRPRNNELRSEIELAMPYLFSDYGGVFLVPDPVAYPAIFDYAVVIVQTDSFTLRFIRGRGEFSADLSFQPAAESWLDLLKVLAYLSGETPIPPAHADVWRVADALQRTMPLLVQSETRERIEAHGLSRD